MPTPDWIKTGIVFNAPGREGAFGLRATQGATKAFQVILQSYILKHLMFERKGSKKAKYVQPVRTDLSRMIAG